MAEALLREAYSMESVTDLVRALYEDRVGFVAGTTELAPGISLHHVGGHTDGLQVVRVWTRRGWVVLASDAAHLYRSEEHTSELQSLMRISYAVFCLKKKKIKK